MFSQADKTGCTLLLRVNGELKDVAKGKIVTPLNRVFHGRPMADDVFRVTISQDLPGCCSLYPPFQPDEADSDLNLEQSVLWAMIWPKALIRVDPSVTTPVQQTQEIGRASCRERVYVLV